MLSNLCFPTSNCCEDRRAISPEKFALEMKCIQDRNYSRQIDNKEVHVLMDNLMCQVLRELGYHEGVTIFEKTPKYYI